MLAMLDLLAIMLTILNLLVILMSIILGIYLIYLPPLILLSSLIFITTLCVRCIESLLKKLRLLQVPHFKLYFEITFKCFNTLTPWCFNALIAATLKLWCLLLVLWVHELLECLLYPFIRYFVFSSLFYIPILFVCFIIWWMAALVFVGMWINALVFFIILATLAALNLPVFLPLLSLFPLKYWMPSHILGV